MVTDSQLEELRSAVTATQPDYLADLERLVNIDCGSYTKHGVDAVGRWVSDQLRELGAEVRVLAHDTYGDTIVADLEGTGRGRALLVGHMDTVFSEGTVAERPFVIEDGRAYGPGVDDMKGGLLSGIYALRALRSTRGGGGPADWLPFERLTFIANPDEEIGSPSSTPHIENAARDATVAFVLESARDNGDIVSARKGINDCRIVVRGRAAHAGVEPEKGRSATLEAAYKTLALHALNGKWEGVTVNVGAIHGGTRPNIVADSCVLEIDLRATTPAGMEAVQAAVRDIAESSTVPDTTSVFESSAHWEPMAKTPRSLPWPSWPSALPDVSGSSCATLPRVARLMPTRLRARACRYSTALVRWAALITRRASTSRWTRSCRAPRCSRRYCLLSPSRTPTSLLPERVHDGACQGGDAR